MALQKALNRAVHRVAPHAEVQIEQLPDGRLTGNIVAEEFEELTHLQRQRLIWEEIRRELGANAQQVGPLLMFTHEEVAAIDPNL